MVKDLSGLEITTDSSAVVDDINSFVDQLLGVGNDAEVVFKAVEVSTPPSLKVVFSPLPTYKSGAKHDSI